jgi:hypothetical protein
LPGEKIRAGMMPSCEGHDQVLRMQQRRRQTLQPPPCSGRMTPGQLGPTMRDLLCDRRTCATYA